MVARRLQGDVAHVVAVDLDGAAGHVVEPGEQPGDRRLARSRSADERDGLAGAVQVEVGEHVEVPAVLDREGDPARRAVGKAHVVEADVARGCPSRSTAPGPLDDGRRLVENLEDALRPRPRRAGPS